MGEEEGRKIKRKKGGRRERREMGWIEEGKNKKERYVILFILYLVYLLGVFL